MPESRIAVVHYHLRPGGVTGVISRTVRALQDDFSFAVLSGEPPSAAEGVECPVAVVGGLGYHDDPDHGTGRGLVARLRESAVATLGGRPDIWHFHNHSLGKNPALGEVISILACDGERLLLHIHDFAEDGRSENYRSLLRHAGGDPRKLSELLYPVADHIHYATINSRDHAALVRAGIPMRQVHLVHNPVEVTAEEEAARADRNDRRRRFLYPSRAIRRKNIGELLLWASLAQDAEFAVTMAPLNPAQRPVYDGWVAFARAHRLPVEFEVGGGSHSLGTLLKGADAVITTSLAEGFGLAFVEPALAGRPIVGRDLPEVTGGLAQLGVVMTGLYNRLDVPIEWIGGDRFREAVGRGLSRARRRFNRETTEADVDAAVAAARQGDMVDFGRLDEPMQESVILRVLGTPGEASRISPGSLAPGPVWGDDVANNCDVITRKLSAAAYAERLCQAYRGLLAAQISDPSAIEGDALLNEFLDPARFILIMT